MEQERILLHPPRGASRAGGGAGIGIAVVLAAVAFFSGAHFGEDLGFRTRVDSLFAASGTAETVDLGEFWEVWDLLAERFVSASSTEPLSEEERVRGAIRGLVEIYGDPYTVYLTPEETELFEGDIAGNFEGVGMEVGSRDGMLTVIAPLPNTPAERAGIRSGDKIIRIDGTPTDGMSIDAAVGRIRGERGTEVMLTIFREGEKDLLEIAVVRERITIPTVQTEERRGVFIIRLYNFSAIAEQKFQEALREYARARTRKLVIDLRGNPGGFLQSAVNIASYFLPAGKVVVREDFGEGREERLYRSSGRDLGRYKPQRIAVLIDSGSASASEIVAGALQAHSVATLIGAKTFGKGSVQELVDLGEGTSLKITIARWLTPQGNSISEGGLTPDIAVTITPEEQERGEDPQLEAAIEHLNR